MKKLIPGHVKVLFAFSLTAFLFIASASFAQVNDNGSRIAKKTAALKQEGKLFKESFLFSPALQLTGSDELKAVLKKYTLLDTKGINNIQQAKPEYISFSIPVDDAGKQVKLLLYKENISPNGFNLITSDGSKPVLNDVVHYRGSIENNLHSLAAFTFSGDEVSGFISNDEGNFVIGKTNATAGKHIVYNAKDMIGQAPFGCATNTDLPLNPVTLAKPADAPLAIATKCVNWYWETDYDLFVNKGSVANVNTYIQAVFNQMATLYANDGMTMLLKTLYVWNAEDPYTGPTTSDYLNQFGTSRTSFDGDLAHLIGLKGSGGIAWIKGLCKSNLKYRMAYSGISSTYKTVPNYSWTVECITHEQGHLLGSPHTHDCSWNGNNTKIDGCGDAAGYTSGTCEVPALPTGGTIMSYCHLTKVGINFNLGFGPQPTDLMIKNINAATCLVACTTSCTVPSQPGAITGNTAVCEGTSQTYSVAAVSGATSYTWSLPSGWTGTSATNSITVTAGATGGSISVRSTNSCGNSTAQTLSITTTALPVQPGVISGNTAVCAGTAQTYSITAVANASSYAWVLPQGWSGTSTGNTISVTTGTAGGTILVNAANSCGSSGATTANLVITAAMPLQPSTVTGSTSVCTGTSQTYSVTAVSGVDSYVWTLPQGWTGSSATNSITVTTGTAGGDISVKAVNGCGTGPARSIAVGINTSSMPAKPGEIFGSSIVCPNAVRSYYVNKVAGATSYLWTIPAGATMIDSLPAFIRFSYGSNAGTITVKAVNACGSSAASSKIVGLFASCTSRLQAGGIVQSVKPTVYPNPAKDKITVMFKGTNNTTYTINITDMVGRVVVSEKKQAAEGMNLHSLNVSKFSKGTYLISIQTKNSKEVLKVNIE